MKIWRKAAPRSAMIIVALLCAYAVRVVIEHGLLNPARTSILQWLASPKTNERQNESDESGLFLDSILSIIQSYYVDSERVATRDLCLAALKVFAANKQVTFTQKTQRVILRVENEAYDLPLPEHPSFDQTLDFYRYLSDIAIRHKIPFADSNHDDQSAPQSAKLMNAVLRSLDAHSALLSPEAYHELKQGTEGSFGGLGVLVGIRDQILTVLKPIPGSPAEKSGIRKNDRILDINGVHTFGKSLESLIEHMRGDPGSVVHLSLLRFGARSPMDLNLRREIVQVDSVVGKEISYRGEQFLHLTIENFASRTSREVRNALQAFRAAKKGAIPGVILDLRSNPGGLLDQAVQVADIFLPSGVIVSTKGRREEIETAIADHDETGYPLMVLIDEDSASASEIVAGALQDQGRAVIIGQPSFGKGSVQTIFELPDDRALKLTIARYFTPNGRSIQNVGITPDIWLQPALKKDSNTNILGELRYKNERFLRHHLEVFGQADPDAQKGPYKKAYYLAQDHSHDDDSTRGSPQDQELTLAMMIMEKVVATYGSKLPVGSMRASHWLGLAGPIIQKKLLDMDGQTSAWLAKQHHISWSPSREPLIAPNMILSIEEKSTNEVTVGGEIVLLWRIKNNDSHPIHRLSLFVRADDSEFETRELLLGSIQPGQVLKGRFEVPIIPNFTESSLNLDIGLAIDAKPLPSVHADHLVEIRQKPMAHLKANLVLTEEHGGSLPGVLEQGEKAKIKLHIDNDGNVMARDLKIEVVNLSGSQFSLMKAPTKPFQIEPHQSIDLLLDVVASQKLDSKELSLGIFVDGENLKEPFRNRSMIKSQVSRKVSAEKSTALGH